MKTCMSAICRGDVNLLRNNDCTKCEIYIKEKKRKQCLCGNPIKQGDGICLDCMVDIDTIHDLLDEEL